MYLLSGHSFLSSDPGLGGARGRGEPAGHRERSGAHGGDARAARRPQGLQVLRR